jgi:hypothetical protein
MVVRPCSAVYALVCCCGCVIIKLPPPPRETSVSHPGAVVYVVDGTYGGNCGAPWGNATRPLAVACNGLPSCAYRVDYRAIGDPAVNCGKEFVAQWRCDDVGEVYRTVAPPEAGYGAIIIMTCDRTAQPAPLRTSVGTIEIISATYGLNCGASPGNETAHLAEACNGKPECLYRVDYTAIGDPVPGCGKDYVVEWRCAGSRSPRRIRAAPEAGYGAVITLTCAGS